MFYNNSKFIFLKTFKNKSLKFNICICFQKLFNLIKNYKNKLRNKTCFKVWKEKWVY